MANGNIVEKLRKVLALTSSPIEGEAQAAAATLARLLAEYNIEMSDLEAAGVVAKPSIEEGGHDLGNAAFAWKLELADMLADHYFCVSLTDRTTKKVKFAGRPENVKSLQMLYAWLINQTATIAREDRRKHFAETGEHIDPLRWQLGFGKGAVARLAERLQERREREASEAGSALMLHHTAEVSDYLEEKYGFRKDGRKTRKQQAWDEEWQAKRAAKLKLKQEDPEAYYAEYPWERPEILTPDEQRRAEAANARKRAQQDRRWERASERRREAEERRYYSHEETEKRAQTSRANSAGRRGAERVNIEPFIGAGTGDPDRKRMN
jgi:hypothetical protein